MVYQEQLTDTDMGQGTRVTLPPPLPELSPLPEVIVTRVLSPAR